MGKGDDFLVIEVGLGEPRALTRGRERSERKYALLCGILFITHFCLDMTFDSVIINRKPQY